MSKGTSSIGDRVASFIVAHPFVSMMLAFLMFAVAMPGGQFIKANFTHTSFFYEDDPEILKFEEFNRRFGSDEAVILIVHSPSGIFDPESAELMRNLTADMWQLPYVMRVDTIANFQWVHANGDDIVVESLLPESGPLTPDLLEARKQVALSHEVIPGYLVSADGTTAVAYGFVRPELNNEAHDVKKIADAAVALQQKYRVGDHDLRVSGGPPIANAFAEIGGGDAATLTPIVFTLAFVVLTLSFRTVAGVVLPMGVVIGAVMITMTSSGWFGVELTNMNTVVPQILIAIGVSDAVHVMHSFYNAWRSGLERRAAVHDALASNFVPTLLTAVTTAIGFYGSLLADLQIVAGLGILAGTGALVAWALTYFLMGPVLLYFPIWTKQDGTGSQEDLHAATPGATAYATAVYRYRVPILVVSTALTLVGLVVGATVPVSADPVKYFKASHPVRADQDFLVEKLGGVLTFEVMVDAGEAEGIKDPAFMKNVDALQEWLEQQPGVTKTLSVSDILKDTNRALMGGTADAYALPADRELLAQELFLYQMSLPQGMSLSDRVTVDNSAVRVTVLSSVTASQQHIALQQATLAKAAELGLQARTTGKNDLWQSVSVPLVTSFFSSLLGSLLGIGAIFVFALRSVRLAVLALIPNIAPIFISASVLKILGQPVDIGIVVVASVALGIAVDDTIHTVTHFVRYRDEGVSPIDAFARVYAHTGKALVLTTVVLVVSFAVFAFGNYVPNIWFGTMTSIVLGIALIADLLMLPALFFVALGGGEQGGAAQPAMARKAS